MMALAQTRQDELSARTAGLTLANQGWTGAARAEAAGRLGSMGLPGRRDEYWRYTNPAGLTGPVAAAPVLETADEPPLFAAIDALRLVFVDGVFDAVASDDLQGEGLRIDLLSRVSGLDIHWAQGLFGHLEATGQAPVPRPLAALNTAYAAEGVLVHVTGQATRPISLTFLRRNLAADAMLHHCIRVDAGASVTLLEHGAAAARLNTVMEVDLADDAQFHHIRVQGRDHDRQAATHLFARLGRRSLFKSFTLTANGQLTRNEAVLDLVGDDCVAHLAGAALGDGRFHHDDTVFVTHQGLRCESRQVFKKVLKNAAVGVFQGKILVKPGAQKTDGYQISQALLLDDDSQFLAKPELEIYADDVKCSHGSTTGAIDETALFYLQSRGVPRTAAQSLLILAFLADTIDEIADPAIAEDIRLRLEGWLARHGH